MQNFKNYKKLYLLIDASLILLSLLSCVTIQNRLYLIGTISCCLFTAIFSLIPFTNSLPASCITATLVMIPPILFCLLFSNLLIVCLLLISIIFGYIISLFIAKAYPKINCIAILTIILSLLFIVGLLTLLISEDGKINIENINLFFTEYENKLNESVEHIFEDTERYSLANDTIQMLKASIESVFFQLKVHIVGYIVMLFAIISIFITFLAEKFAKAENWKLYTPKLMCKLYIVFSVVDLFIVSSYDNIDSIRSSVSLIFVALANIAVIFAPFMLVNGIRKIYSYSPDKKILRNFIIALLIFGAILDLYAEIILVAFIGAITSIKSEKVIK